MLALAGKKKMVQCNHKSPFSDKAIFTLLLILLDSNDNLKCNITTGFQEPLFTEDAILWSLVWVIFTGTVLGLIGVRLATQHSTERRYQQYNAFREKV